MKNRKVERLILQFKTNGLTSRRRAVSGKKTLIAEFGITQLAYVISVDEKLAEQTKTEEQILQKIRNARGWKIISIDYFLSDDSAPFLCKLTQVLFSIPGHIRKTIFIRVKHTMKNILSFAHMFSMTCLIYPNKSFYRLVKGLAHNHAVFDSANCVCAETKLKSTTIGLYVKVTGVELYNFAMDCVSSLDRSRSMLCVERFFPVQVRIQICELTINLDFLQRVAFREKFRNIVFFRGFSQLSMVTRCIFQQDTRFCLALMLFDPATSFLSQIHPMDIRFMTFTEWKVLLAIRERLAVTTSLCHIDEQLMNGVIKAMTRGRSLHGEEMQYFKSIKVAVEMM